RCHERATCVLDPGPHERPDDRWGSSSVPGFGPTLQGKRSSRVDHRRGAKKSLCCVTTRRCNRWFLNDLRCGLHPLAARARGLGMPRFDSSVLTVSGLSPCRLPTVDLSPAFQILAVALVPGPRLIRAPTPLAEADPGARAARSGRAAPLWLTVRCAHGR